jgi:hypothetical protein
LAPLETLPPFIKFLLAVGVLAVIEHVWHMRVCTPCAIHMPVEKKRQMLIISILFLGLYFNFGYLQTNTHTSKYENNWRLTTSRCPGGFPDPKEVVCSSTGDPCRSWRWSCVSPRHNGRPTGVHYYTALSSSDNSGSYLVGLLASEPVMDKSQYNNKNDCKHLKKKITWEHCTKL